MHVRGLDAVTGEYRRIVNQQQPKKGGTNDGELRKIESNE